MELFEKLIVKSLGLQGVKLESWEACDKDLKLVLHARQDRETANCNQCGCQISHVHEWKLRKIKAAPIGAYEEVWIYLKQLRGSCYMCDDKVRSADVEFVHPNFENMTYLLVEKVRRLCEEMTCESVARILRLNPKSVWSLDQKNVKDFRKALTIWYRYARESKLKPFLKFAKTLRKYRSYIEGYVMSGLTTAVSEGLNNKIKVLEGWVMDTQTQSPLCIKYYKDVVF